MKKIIAFLLVILCVLPVFAGCYNGESIESAKKLLVGSWTFAEDTECGEYIIFDEEGNVRYTIGGFSYYGTYELKKVKQGRESFIVLESDFSMFNQEDEYVTVDFTDDKLIIGFTEEDLELVRKDLPEFKIDPTKITHASADELDATELVIDERVVGEWTLEIVGYAGAYETYTFRKDGTCSYKTDFIPAVGYGMAIEYKYTTKDGKMFMTQEMFNGTTSDMFFEYKIENGKLVVENDEIKLSYSPVK